MSSAGEAADAARPSLQRANTSILSQSLASIPSSPAPLAAPPNTSTSNPPPHTASSNPTVSNQPTAQPQTEQTTSTPAPPPPPTQAPNPTTTTTTTPARPPVPISQLPHRQHPTSWQPVAARIHHRDDDVRSYCAPGSNGWVEWQERRVADSQAEIGRIDHDWDGGEIIDYAERRRLKRLRRVRAAEWLRGLGEGHAEGEEKEGGRGGDEEGGEEEGGEEEKADAGDGEETAKVGNEEEMEVHEEAEMRKGINGTETDSETSSETVKEKVWKGKERAVEQNSEASCSSRLEAQGKKEEQEGDVLKECKRGQDDEDDDELSQAGSDECPEWVSTWKRVVMASRAQVGSPAYRAAEQRLSGTRLSYLRENQSQASRPTSH